MREKKTFVVWVILSAATQQKSSVDIADANDAIFQLVFILYYSIVSMSVARQYSQIFYRSISKKYVALGKRSLRCFFPTLLGKNIVSSIEEDFLNISVVKLLFLR